MLICGVRGAFETVCAVILFNVKSSKCLEKLSKTVSTYVLFFRGPTRSKEIFWLGPVGSRTGRNGALLTL